MTPEDPHAPHNSKPREIVELHRHLRTGTPFLAWRPPDAELTFFTLDAARPVTTLGRTRAADVRLTCARQISKLHAELRPLATHWVLADDGLSTNGTFVGGERVTARRRL